jgi:hypothetical protein
VADQDKAIVATCGGVDSSVAAGLFQDAGYEVTGVFMCVKHAEGSGNKSRKCCSPKDAADAQEGWTDPWNRRHRDPCGFSHRARHSQFRCRICSGTNPQPVCALQLNQKC